MSALSAAADVTAGTIYYYFGSKTGLYEAVVADTHQHLNDNFIEPVLAIIDAQPSFDARLAALVNVLALRARTDGSLYRLIFASDFEGEHFPAVKTFRDTATADLRRLYLGVCGFSASERLKPDQLEILAFVETLVLGMFYFSVRPGGLERLPVFVRAFGLMLDDELFAD